MIVRRKIIAHALLPAAECRRVVLKFGVHETRSVDTRATAVTHAVPVTVTVDTAVGMLAKGRVPSSFGQERIPQMRVIRRESRSRNCVNTIPCLGGVRLAVEASSEWITLGSNTHYRTRYRRWYPRRAKGIVGSITRSGRCGGSRGGRLWTVR